MKEEIKHILGVSGEVLIHKSKSDIIKEIRHILDNAESKYNANKLDDLNKEDKDKIKELFDLLGLKHNF